MEVKINVEESRFKDVLDKELAAFNEDELHEILKSAMMEYLMNDETLKNVFLQKKYSGWNNERFDYAAAPILEKMVSKVELEPIFEDVKKRVLEYMTSEEVIKGMATELFSKLVQNGVTNYLVCNQDFLSQMAYRISNIIRPQQ